MYEVAFKDAPRKLILKFSSEDNFIDNELLCFLLQVLKCQHFSHLFCYDDYVRHPNNLLSNPSITFRSNITLFPLFDWMLLPLWLCEIMIIAYIRISATELPSCFCNERGGDGVWLRFGSHDFTTALPD